MSSDPKSDPVLAQRNLVRKATVIGQRLGYSAFILAMVAFFVGLIVGFDSGASAIAVFGLVSGSVCLAPAMVFSYAVKAADREDAGEGDDWR